MRRIGIQTWLLLLLIALLLPSAAAEAPAASYAIVTAEEAVMYAGQDAEAAPLASLNRGTWAEVLDQADDWLHLRLEDSTEGYVSAAAVTIPEVRRGVVGIVRNPDEQGLLNLRAQPDWDAEVLSTYHSGVPCLLLSLRDSWYHVRVNGMEGYFREEFIRPFYGPWSDTVATVMAPEGAELHLRTGPGREQPSLRACASGTCVMVLTEGDTWWQVALDGQVGFMNAAFLRKGVHRDLSTANDEEENRWSVATVENPESNQLLNLRESPSRDSRSLGRFPTGTEVYILRQGIEWCKVRLVEAPESIGFMATPYLRLEGLPEVPTLTVTHPEESFVNLRAFPMTTLGIVLARVPHGEKVEVLVPDDTWVKVRYGGTTGYMLAYYLR